MTRVDTAERTMDHHITAQPIIRGFNSATSSTCLDFYWQHRTLVPWFRLYACDIGYLIMFPWLYTK